MKPLLEISDLAVSLPVDGSQKPVLHGVSLSVGDGEAVGLVGESGSGKSMTARAIARLLPAGAQAGGSVRFADADVLALRGPALRRHRRTVATVFQDPRAHINPVRRIGDFMTESLRLQGVNRRAASANAAASLAAVGISDGERRLHQFPHELSGGLLQRVMIATMLLTEPRLLLADEPTTALDVTTQSEVMRILDELRRERGMALLFITHDLELAAAVCDRTAVMYAGTIVETSPSSELHTRPRHPYTAALCRARPSVTQTHARLLAIPGRPVSAFEAPPGCPFAPRCEFAQDPCRERMPTLEAMGDGSVRCTRANELRGRLVTEGLHV